MGTKTLLLVMPPQGGLLEGFSSGLVALGNYVCLNNKDTQVRLVDLGPVPPSRMVDLVHAELRGLSSLLFAGITGPTASYPNMLRTSKAVKDGSADVITIFRGTRRD